MSALVAGFLIDRTDGTLHSTRDQTPHCLLDALVDFRFFATFRGAQEAAYIRKCDWCFTTDSDDLI